MFIVDQRYVNLYSSHHSSSSSSISSLKHILFHYHTHLQMVDVAVEGGGIIGDANNGEGCWGEGLEVARVVGSGVVAVSHPDWTLSFSSNIMSTHNFQFS